MGEYADQILMGECCELCMAPFVYKKEQETIYEHGYPVVCNGCWSSDLKDHHQKQHKDAQAL